MSHSRYIPLYSKEEQQPKAAHMDEAFLALNISKSFAKNWISRSRFLWGSDQQ